jgi:NADPH-dependent 7-cyano-7-deazaguanine reductase QueF
LQVCGHGKPTHLSIQYVPDRTIVDPDAFGHYLEALAGLEWESLEALATAVLGDFSDQLVGRWIRVVAIAPEGAYPGVGSHEVVIEDRQPDWDNPSLLSRIRSG